MPRPASPNWRRNWNAADSPDPRMRSHHPVQRSGAPALTNPNSPPERLSNSGSPAATPATPPPPGRSTGLASRKKPAARPFRQSARTTSRLKLGASPNWRRPMALPRFSVYLAILSPLGVGMGLMTWLTLGLDFDTKTSPGWQFVPYFVMTICLMLGSAIMCMLPDLIWTGKLKILSTLLIFPLFGAFLAWSWVHHGPYESFRDDQIFKTVLRTTATSLVWFTTLASLQFALMLVLLIGREMGWRWVSRFEGPSWILLPIRSSDSDDLGESGVGQKDPNNPE